MTVSPFDRRAVVRRVGRAASSVAVRLEGALVCVRMFECIRKKCRVRLTNLEVAIARSTAVTMARPTWRDSREFKPIAEEHAESR